MAQKYRNVGGIESSDALASLTDGDGAYMDFDTGAGNAHFGAKGGAGANRGVLIRTLLDGAAVAAISIAASGAVTFASALTALTVSGASSLQAVTLRYDASNIVQFAVSSVGGLTITPMPNEAVSVTGFNASGLASFSAQTRIGDLFRVESIASPDVTGLTGAGVEIRYDPAAKGIIKAYDYTGAVNVPLTLVASSYDVTGGDMTLDAGLRFFLGGASGTEFIPKLTYDGLGVRPQETAPLTSPQTVEIDGGTSVCMAIIVSGNGDVGIAALAGANHATSVTPIRGNWSTVQGTVGTNVYWNAGTSRYRLENNTGGTLSYSIMKIGNTVAM